MTKLKELDHPVDEEEFLEYQKSYAKYLQEGIAARDRGENIDDVVEEVSARLKRIGILDEDGNITPEYSDAMATLDSIIRNNKR